MTRDDVEDSYGDDCHPDAIEALCQAWQVSIIDPEWGRNDVLWPCWSGSRPAPHCHKHALDLSG